MKNTRKIISLLLSLLMIITSVPLMAVESFAADSVKSGTTGECTWTLDGTVLTISGNGEMGYYNYDSNYSSPWGTLITKAVIENGVTSIGTNVFRGCTSLKSVNIPDRVTSIGSGDFGVCTSLTSETITDSVTSIGNWAFSGCTSLTSVTIPDSVTSIGTDAFSNTAYYNNESNWDNEFLYIGNYLIKAKENVSGNVEIRQGTKTIADSAFSGCTSLKSVNIPDSVTSIGYGVFEDCASLTSVTIPNSVTEIDYGVFRGCTSLTSITIPDGVTSIGEWAFESCTSLTSITIPDGVTSIGEEAFGDCTSLTSITIPDSVTSIGICAFENTAYYNNSSNWDNGVLYIGNHLIEAKDNISGNVEIRQSTKTIADYAFCNCNSLTSVTIGENVKSIGIHAFFNCHSLKSVKLSDTTTEIGKKAFGYYYDGHEKKRIHGFTIYGNKGSEAERYANENGFEFLPTESAPSKFFPDVIRGDWYYNAVNFMLKKVMLQAIQTVRSDLRTTFRDRTSCLFLRELQVQTFRHMRDRTAASRTFRQTHIILLRLHGQRIRA